MKVIRIILALLVAILMWATQGQAQVTIWKGIEPQYVEDMMRRVETVAGCKAVGPYMVFVDECSGLKELPDAQALYLGYWCHATRRVMLLRPALCPQLLAHELAHIVVHDNYPDTDSETREKWADIISAEVAGPWPEWLTP